ncbi:AzlC family ABC transporter permease [Methylopila sp. Yamaguchi]|uniref:AzlC family ABC transporter permease n=1 Tax=Methylopila sp. Yamaguchi TaxID=1437817 RepID=UPI000CB54F22|nr:AzlC family ABC transporter permease [Methylopila sp. Yamaguchi]GBD49050.1 branched-chain amino acid permease [Methylopila sp. Yamaguchi]
MTAGLREVRDGLRDIAPAAIAAIPIGLLFGALMASKGLTPAEVALMSGFVCAGGAQLAAVELWVHPAPILALAVSTVLIDARHVLMSTSLARRTEAFAWWQKMLGFYVMSDENWALGERRAAERTLTPAYFITMGATLWINWVTTTTLGAIGGAMLGDPRVYGADFAFTALFIGLAAAFVRGPGGMAVVAASGLASAATYVGVGAPWHVAAGAAAGVATAWALAGEDEEEALA